MSDLPYAREAVELWHENGLTVEFLEGMTYNHRVQLVEAARRWVDHMTDTIVCPTCGGSDCIDGRQPSPEVLERMAKAMHKEHCVAGCPRSPNQLWLNWAKAAWLAEHKGEE